MATPVHRNHAATAMTMGHRVAVLKDGVLQQCDTPQNLYHSPANQFVAGFIGSPAMNLIDVEAGAPTLAGIPLGIDDPALDLAAVRAIGFRPEVASVGSGPFAGEIRTVEDLGSEVFVHVLLPHLDEAVSVVLKAAPPFAGRPHENLSFGLSGPVHLFDGDGACLATATLDVA